jgi:hypothetical protein
MSKNVLKLEITLIKKRDFNMEFSKRQKHSLSSTRYGTDSNPKFNLYDFQCLCYDENK